MAKVPDHAQFKLYLQNEINERGQYTDKLRKNGDDYSVIGVILVGYCDDTLAYFNALFNAAKKSFPELTEKEFTCGKVRSSPCYKGFTVVEFNATNFLTGWSPEEKTEHGYKSYKPCITPDGREWDVCVNMDFWF